VVIAGRRILVSDYVRGLRVPLMGGRGGGEKRGGGGGGGGGGGRIGAWVWGVLGFRLDLKERRGGCEEEER